MINFICNVIVGVAISNQPYGECKLNSVCSLFTDFKNIHFFLFFKSRKLYRIRFEIGQGRRRNGAVYIPLADFGTDSFFAFGS